MKKVYRYRSSYWRKIRHQYVNDKPSSEQLEEALGFITETLKQLQIEYALTAGTCLGIHRDGQLIQNDDDIDIDLLNYEYKQKIRLLISCLELRKIVFRLGESYAYPKISMFYKRRNICR